VKAEEIADVISRFLFEVVPPGTKELVLRRFTVGGERPASLIVFALSVSLWAGSGLILSLIDGFNAVYKLPINRPMVRGRLVAIGLVFACALPALGASAMIMFGSRTEHWLVTSIGMQEQGEQLVGGVLLFGKLIRYTIAFAAVVLTMMGLYKLGPARPQAMKYIWPGAVISTLLWLGATLVFSWYVRDIADYNLFYGSIGAVIALLLWMYMLSLITMFGCAFNAEYQRLDSAAEGLRP
jgi:membrane protein